MVRGQGYSWAGWQAWQRTKAVYRPPASLRQEFVAGLGWNAAGQGARKKAVCVCVCVCARARACVCPSALHVALNLGVVTVSGGGGARQPSATYRGANRCTDAHITQCHTVSCVSIKNKNKAAVGQGGARGERPVEALAARPLGLDPGTHPVSQQASHLTQHALQPVSTQEPSPCSDPAQGCSPAAT